MTFYVLSVWLHVLAATIWIGSMVFFAIVIVPVLRRENASPLILPMGKRFGVLGRITLTTLILTGALNLHLRGITWANLGSHDFWSQDFGRMLAWKLLFVVLVVAATAFHDVRSARSPRVASAIGRFMLLASLVILFFAVAMVRGFG